jgi:aminopeptidase N
MSIRRPTVRVAPCRAPSRRAVASIAFAATGITACASRPPAPAPAPAVEAAPAVDTTPPTPPPPDYLVFREGPLVVWGASPPGSPHEERPRTYDLRHQLVRLRVDWPRRALVGSTTLTVAPLDTAIADIALDAVGMTIGAVRDASGDALRHDYDGRSLVVHLDAPLRPGSTTRVVVDYETVRPRKGAYFVDRRRVLWTQGAAEDTRHWIPTWDHPNDRTTWEIVARVPRGEKALSNGRLVSTRRIGGEEEWHWRLDQPAPTYLMSLVTGDYVVLQDTWRTVPIGYWTYPDSVDAAWRAFGKTPRMVDLFSEHTRVPYPWPKYDQSVAPDFVFGGMENVTATTQSDDGILHPAWAEPQANAEPLVAHELGHQWFGGLVTPRDWRDAWLSESFATYLELVWAIDGMGAAEGAYRRLEAQERAIAADRAARRPLVWDVWASDPLEVFLSGHIYDRGATVLFMLRRELGDAAFRRALTQYATRHAYAAATTEDFREAVESSTGRALDRFFAQWIYGAGFPVFRVRADYDSATRRLALVAEQTQPTDSLTGFFEADVEVVVATADSLVRAVVAVRDSISRLELALPGPPAYIRWDAGGWLLDVADFPRPTAMLAAQLVRDADVLGRVEAVMLLGERPRDTLAVRALAGAARNDAFRGVRERAIGRLVAMLAAGPIEDDAAHEAARAAIRGALGDRDARVREAAAAGLGALPAATRAPLLARALTDSSRYVRVAALRAWAADDPEGAMPTVRGMLDAASWRDLERVAAIRALGGMRSAEARALLVAQLEPGRSRAVRTAAIDELTAPAPSAPTAIPVERLAALLDDPDLFVRQAAARALGRSGEAAAIPPLERRRLVEAEGRVITDIDAALAALAARRGR